MREQPRLLADLAVDIIAIVVAVAKSAVIFRGVVPASRAQADLLLQIHLYKWPDAPAPMIAENRFSFVVVQTRLSFHAGLRFVAERKTGGRCKPFRSAIQIFKRVRCGD